MKIKSFALIAGILLVTFAAGFSQPTLQFAATSYTVAESAGTVSLTVQRLGDTIPVVGVDYTTVNGTATNSFQYLTATGTLAFAAGVTNQPIAVPILDNGLVQGTKNFRVILSNPTGGAILGVGARTNATVSITDNDVGIQFQFAAYSVAEDAGALLIGIVRGDDGTLPVAVDITTANLSATSGADYTGATNTLAFASQERFKWVTIPILNNNLKQANKTFRVTLSNPVGVSLGSQKTTIITIVDNDQGFRFEFSTNSIGEDAGAALINVLRGTDDTNSAVTVDIATSDLSAIKGVDYLGLTNTLAFAPGETINRIAVPILNNGLKQATRNFRLTLSNPTAGAVLGSATTTMVSIADNDPGVGFEQARYTNAWGSGFVVTVGRGNDWAIGPITVDYTTADVTALAGQDYQAIAGTLHFQPNETVKTLTIPLLHNRATEGTQYFRLTLSNPTGGATLGTATALFFIVGSYFPVAPPFDTALTIHANGNWNTLSWAGGGLLQRADNPTGPWHTLTTANSPYTVQSPIPTTFYRVARPRPVNLYVPSGYDSQAPMPLVILLHEYTATGADVEAYMQFRPLAEARGFLYCYPDSPTDRWGNPFWNATDACCDFGSNGVDDVGYLRGLIAEIGRQFAVDPKSIYLVGHSTGGHMAYGMTCQYSDLVAGMASLAGMTFLNPSNCAPSQPVNILHIHGTADSIVPYAGGADTTGNPEFDSPANMPAFPGALQDVQTWATYNGASGPVTDPAPSLDLTTDIVGLDTVRTRYTNAPPGGAVELWTINGGTHSPTLSSQFSPLVIDWLLAHPKP